MIQNIKQSELLKKYKELRTAMAFNIDSDGRVIITKDIIQKMTELETLMARSEYPDNMSVKEQIVYEKSQLPLKVWLKDDSNRLREYKLLDYVNRTAVYVSNYYEVCVKTFSFEEVMLLAKKHTLINSDGVRI